MIKQVKKNKIHVKKGDIVQIISGRHKGQIGEINKVLYKTSRVVIKNTNLRTKHIRPKQEADSGKIISFEAPIHSSNVMLYSTQHKTRSRFRVTLNENNIKCRMLKKTNEII